MIETGRQFGTSTQLIGTQASGFETPSEMTATDLAEILFCSSLQPSERIDAAAVRAAVEQSLRTHGNRVTACAGDLAEAYGKDPEGTCRRMRWCRELVGQVFDSVPAFS